MEGEFPAVGLFAPWQPQEGHGFRIYRDGASDERLAFARAVARGLESVPRSLDSRWLYDAEGSRLFEHITRTPEYGPTRAEERLLRAHAGEIRERTGPVALAELGAGSAVKTRHLLDAFCRRGTVRYVPIDVSGTALASACAALARAYADRGLIVEGLAASFHRALPLLPARSPLCLMLLGSSLGNFDRPAAERFLAEVAACLRPGDFFLVGIDLVQDPRRIEAAYNDAAGWTAAFTRNVFARMSRELGADLPLEAIEHVAFYDERLERVEIAARFGREARFEVAPLGRAFRIAAGEQVRTEISCKYRVPAFVAQAARVGLVEEVTFEDLAWPYALLLLRRPPGAAPLAREGSERGRIESLLGQVRLRTHEIVAPLDENELRRQPDSLMSPILWDLGHVAAYEEQWLCPAPAGNRGASLPELFDPLRHPRAERGRLPVPDAAATRQRLDAVRAAALGRLRAPAAPAVPDGPLADARYLYRMVAQHEAQHQETILAALQLRADLVYEPPFAAPAAPAVACSPAREPIVVPEGWFPMGTDDRRVAWDNERPRHDVHVEAYRIDAAPVTNGRYLDFVRDGGYRRRELWTEAGWQWRCRSGAEAPAHWEEVDGRWTARVFGRRLSLDPDRPVVHVCWFEADAFARWCKRRLPTESEWEKAAAWDDERGVAWTYPWGDEPPTEARANLDQRLLEPAPVGAYPAGRSSLGCHQMLGDVWEWTASWFEPYPGFEAFPYRDYSEVHFGARCRVLRGGSWATPSVAVRCTFRNWDFPERRQIFAGFRCADDGDR